MNKRLRLALCLSSVAFFFLSSQSISSVVTRYARDIGASISMTGFIWSIVFLTSLLVKPVSGHLADKFGSYKVMGAGALTLAIAGLLYNMLGFKGVFAGRLLQGVATGLFIAPSIAATAALAGEKTNVAIGLRSALISVSGLIAPIMACYILDLKGYRVVFYLSMSLAVTCLALAVSSRGGEVSFGEEALGWRESVNRVVILVFLATITVAGAYMSLIGLVQAHYRDLGFKASIYGLFYTAFAAGSSITRVVAGRASERLDPVKIAIAGHIILSISLVVLSVEYKPPISYAIAPIIGVGCGLSAPTHQLIVIRAVEPGGRNKALSVYSMGFDLGGFLIAIASGYIASIYGYNGAYRFLSALPLFSIAMLILILITYRSKS